MNIFNNLYSLLFYQTSNTDNYNELRVLHDKNEILSVKNKLKPVIPLLKTNTILTDIKNKNYKLKSVNKIENNRCDYLTNMLNKIRVSII
jgi:hypothetical protein